MTHIVWTTLFSLLSALPQPQAQVLEVSDAIWDLTVVDLDDDGHEDLLLLTCNPYVEPMRKALHVFRGSETGRFARQPDTVLRLSPEASALFVASLQPEAPPAILVGSGSGFQAYHYAEDALEAGAHYAVSSIIPDGAREPLFLDDIVRDWTGDGVEEWLLPQADGYALFRGADQVGFIACDVVRQVRQPDSMSVSYHLPEYILFELADTLNPAIAFMYPEEIEFAYGADWAQRHRMRIPGKRQDQYRSYTALRDLNGDGLPDLVVTEMEGTVSMDSTTRVYLADAPFVYPDTPSTTLENQGSIAAPFFYDLDNSGTLDALVVSVPFGPRNLMNYFFRKRVSVNIDVFRLLEGRFEETASAGSSLGMDAPEGRGRPAYSMGDFTGNGSMDVAYAESAGSLAIHFAQDGALIGNRPDVTVNLPTTMGEVRLHDITGNGGEDIVLFHPDSANSTQVQIITFPAATP